MINNDFTQQLERVFTLQKNEQSRHRVPTAEKRRNMLGRLKSAIITHQDDICSAMYQDLRRHEQSAMASEVLAALAEIDEACANLDDWMATQRLEPSAALPGCASLIRYEPRGQILILGPWNFPVGLILQPLIAALAAGNRVIVKPNEMAPACSAVVTKIIHNAFDESEVAVFEGGVDLANKLLDLPFNHIFFTGSPRVGRTIMQAAARHLSSVTLELGGKNPALIDASADIAIAAQTIAGARCINSGQLCLCPDHVYIPRDSQDQLVEHLKQAFSAMFYQDGTLNGDALGKIIDDRNFARIEGYINDAVAKGARIVVGGGLDAGQRLIEPTVLVDVPEDALIMQEEIFGPVLPIIAYDNIDSAMDMIHTRGRPLAAYLFSNSRQVVEEFLNNTVSGGVTINGVIRHAVDSRLPFGGINESGIGRYHGIHGFYELSHQRSVVEMSSDQIL